MSDAIAIALIVAVPATLVAIANGVIGILTLQQAARTHGIVNSRLDEFKDELVKATRLEVAAAFSAGQKQGIVTGRDAAEAREDARK